MKRILTIITALIIGVVSVLAQQNTSNDMLYDGNRISKERIQAFSKEGRQHWKSEFTLRYRAGLFSNGVMVTGGIRVNEKRTIGLFTGIGEIFYSAIPASAYSLSFGITYRRYWHLGDRKIFAFYSDLYAGAGYIYKVSNPELHEDKGNFLFIGGWQPGIRIRCYKNLHLFLGPTLATDCIGLHLGLGF